MDASERKKISQVHTKLRQYLPRRQIQPLRIILKQKMHRIKEKDTRVVEMCMLLWKYSTGKTATPDNYFNLSAAGTNCSSTLESLQNWILRTIIRCRYSWSQCSHEVVLWYTIKTFLMRLGLHLTRLSTYWKHFSLGLVQSVWNKTYGWYRSVEVGVPSSTGHHWRPQSYLAVSSNGSRSRRAPWRPIRARILRG